MVFINPLQVLLWTFRRNEHDVVNLYNTLSPLMQLAAGTNMLNFGYWNNNVTNPLEAQNELCNLVGDLANLRSAKTLLDIGSGFSHPAIYWKSLYKSINISCVNINFSQLQHSIQLVSNNISEKKTNSLSLLHTNGISMVNATSTKLPFADNSTDRIIALESAQHFKPFNSFVQESRRILGKDGLFVIAMPVVTVAAERLSLFMKLGILSLTWSSEHYALNNIKSTITKEGFKIIDIQHIGQHVFEPLTDYYIQNRSHLQDRILKEYPAYLENILYKSLLKMKEVSQKRIIDYVLIKCNLNN